MSDDNIITEINDLINSCIKESITFTKSNFIEYERIRNKIYDLALDDYDILNYNENDFTMKN